MRPAEKRQYKRLDSLHLLDYQTIDISGNEGEYAMGRTLDLSVNGIRLETDRKIPEDTPLIITLAVEDELVDIQGTPVHSLSAESWHLSGIEFKTISREGRSILARYIEALQSRRKRLVEHDYPPLQVDNL